MSFGCAQCCSLSVIYDIQILTFTVICLFDKVKFMDEWRLNWVCT